MAMVAETSCIRGKIGLSVVPSPYAQVLHVGFDGLHVVAVVDGQDQRRRRSAGGGTTSSRSSTPSCRASSMVCRTRPGPIAWSTPEVVPGQLLGVDQPPPPRVADDTGRIAGRAARAGRLGQRPTAVPRRLHRPEEGGAHLVVLQHLDRGRRGPAGRGDPLAQHRRVLTGLAQHGGRAEHRLHDQLGGDVARQAEVHPGLDHRLDDEEEVRRTGPGDGGDGVLVALRHGHHPTGGRQDLA